MGIDFGSLIIDLETLESSSKEDFSIKFWSNYETYLKKYNLLLNDLQSIGFFKELISIDPVPLSDQSFTSGFSEHEQAKLREISNVSNSLLRKVKSLLSPPNVDNRINNQVRSNKIFVVTGKDNEMKIDVTQTLKKLDLDPIILHEEQNGGRTIIENIADYSHISYAVVLLSPDDLGFSEEKTIEDADYRAPQNVIFELGYFLGRLGNKNVTAIYRKKKCFEIPNDYSGVFWVEYKEGWYFELIKELQARNFNIDANKLSWF